MVAVRDITWLAGLLEGEGCFHLNHSITIQLSMTDLDVVERAAAMLGGDVRAAKRKVKDHHKQQYYTRIHGPRAAAWMMTLWSFMGIRRRARISECLIAWKHRQARNNHKEFCKRGHPLFGENMRLTPQRHGVKEMQRVCRTCQAAHHKAFKERKRGDASSGSIH